MSWYRNVVAAGGCVVVSGGAEYRVDRIEPCEAAAGIRAYGNPAALVLRLLHRREFRLLHVGLAGERARRSRPVTRSLPLWCPNLLRDLAKALLLSPALPSVPTRDRRRHVQSETETA